MKLITRDTDYAIRAIMYISGMNGEIVSAADIQNELGLPRPFLRKILQILQKEGVLESVKGNKGGFRLARPAKSISLVDLIEIFQGKISLAECLLKKKPCPDVKKCIVRKKIKGIEKLLVSELKKIIISELNN